jgi:hypothetical protein
MNETLLQPGCMNMSPVWPEVTFMKKHASKGSTQLYIYFLMQCFFHLCW